MHLGFACMRTLPLRIAIMNRVKGTGMSAWRETRAFIARLAPKQAKQRAAQHGRPDRSSCPVQGRPTRSEYHMPCSPKKYGAELNAVAISPFIARPRRAWPQQLPCVDNAPSLHLHDRQVSAIFTIARDYRYAICISCSQMSLALQPSTCCPSRSRAPDESLAITAST